MPRFFASDYREHRHRQYPDPFPMHAIRRVARPTTRIEDDLVPRLDERQTGFARASHGDFGAQIQFEYQRFVPKSPLSGALVAMSGVLANTVDVAAHAMPHALQGNAITAVSSWQPMRPVAPQKAPGSTDEIAMARHMKETAYFLRADAVGICKLPPYAVYSHQKAHGEPIELPHSHAIAILVDQDWYTSSATNGRDWISNSMSFVAYSTSGFIACVLADYIRRLGYSARAHHAMNYQVVVPPILLWAGLGEMCRIGDIVLHPFLGPRFKAAVVTTDMPLAVDQPIDFGMQDFCAKCGKCARECPSGAICSGDKVMVNGYEKWPVDVEKCTRYRIGNLRGAGCGTCIKVCPWNKPYTPFHRAINWTMRHVPLSRNFAVWADDLMGYGKPDPARKWWHDWEEVNGRVTEAGTERDTRPETVDTPPDDYSVTA